MSWRNRVGAAWLGATLLFAGCHPAPHAAAPDTAPLPRLQHDIDSIIDGAPFAHSYWGVLVRSLDRTETLYACNGDKLMMPASNMKVVTLATAAARLGWDYRYETRVEGPAPSAAGIIAGDLVVVGSGDPSIGDRSGASVLERWAAELRARGITRVDGRVVADAGAFADPLGAGWSWDDLAEGYAAPVTALQLDENSIRVTVAPGLREGDGAVVTIAPAGSGVGVENGVATGAPGVAPSIQAWPVAEPRGIRLSGIVPLGSAATTRTLAVPDPALFFAVEFRRALIAAGIDVRGAAVSLDQASPAPRSIDGPPLLTHRSEPLSTLAVRLMKASQNLYAETLLRTIAARGSARATAEEGKAIVQNTIASWGAPVGELIVADGSGLSRYNFVTPATLVTILQHVYGDPRLRDPFVASLPIAGRDGSLANRMKGTAAEANARAKTGSMANVRSVSGYVRSAEGEQLVFSIIANNFETTADVVEAATDAIIVRLASFRR